MGVFTIGYICVQVIIGVFVFIVLKNKSGWYTHTNMGASILTIIGVLGTFSGISYGLWYFDISNIENSIPDLLSGLKLAFLTSLVGIFEAIILKFTAFLVQSYSGGDPGSERIEGLFTSQTDDLQETLSAIKSSLSDQDSGTVISLLSDLAESHAEKKVLLTEMIDEINTELSNIRSSLSGEEGGTVFNQLKELTSTVSEQVGEIATKVGEVATGQLIDALQDVIRDFNKNLNEQFGDNFKQLNEAVNNTVIWQEQYRNQMDQLATEFRIAAACIDRSRESLDQITVASSSIVDRSSHIVSCAENLDPLLHTLNSHLEAFSELRNRAHEAFPLIESRLDELTINFSNTVKAAVANGYENMDSQRKAFITHTEDFKKSSEQFTKTIEWSLIKSQESLDKQREELTERFNDLELTIKEANNKLLSTMNFVIEQLDSMFEKCTSHIESTTSDFTQNLTKKLEDILNDQVKELGGIVERNREDIENHVNILHSALRKEITTLSESLQEQLSESLKILAGNIESLSNGFVENYTQLLDPYTKSLTALQGLVDASEQALQ